jgi:hypothetical protein
VSKPWKKETAEQSQLIFFRDYSAANILVLYKAIAMSQLI